jgi:hypothetical protein
MRTNAENRITWLQFLVLWVTFTVSGAAIAVPVMIHDVVHGKPDVYAVAGAILDALMAILGAVLFAPVAALMMSIPLLLMRDWMRRASTITSMLAAALVGALVGALHPFVILSAVSDYVGGRLSESLRLAEIASAGGGLGGFVAGWWYRASVRNPRGTTGAEVTKDTRP